ncbi:zinc ribbon domain-containing protein [Clostridium sp. Cult2]|uniref:zinc ribbon domain-containing protein n=1 Tax=Clostridium sp. Cult2 TaxID=2079003 RepID=UPI001F2EB4C8|nr:zinc ribbon domain-containing protein [Clostridium sp. Cult2]MCF6465161.1 zinc ribbon domain-containing protein [Clostridium sp. Cult2]
MLQSFTRNYEDNSTEAGFQFTFYCDLCQDGYKSSFIESETYKKNRGLRNLARGVGTIGSFFGGKVGSLGYSLERSGNILSERFEGMSPEWHKEHEKAFEHAKNEAQRHFHRCHGCHSWVCDACYNEDEMLCTDCAPRQDVTVAKARAEAMRRNIDEVAETATVWKGKLESKTVVCQNCGKPAGTGKFCNNCGALLDLNTCSNCGAKNAQGVRFCNQCGASMITPALIRCPVCNEENPLGTKFCGNCGNKLQL